MRNVLYAVPWLIIVRRISQPSPFSWPGFTAQAWTTSTTTQWLSTRPIWIVSKSLRRTATTAPTLGTSLISAVRDRRLNMNLKSGRSSSEKLTNNGPSSSPGFIACDDQYYSVMDPIYMSDGMSASGSMGQPRITLTRYLAHAVKDQPERRDLESLLLAVKMACKTISNLVNRAALSSSSSYASGNEEKDPDHRKSFKDGRYYSMTRLDKLSRLVLESALQLTGKCEMVVPWVDNDPDSPEPYQSGVIIAQALDSNYCAILDPLDGSGNADASICTGTVFGIFEQPKSVQQQPTLEPSRDPPGTTPLMDEAQDKNSNMRDREDELIHAVMQPGKNMRAAGYCLYSSATVLVFTLGDSVQGFTLDPQAQEFILTHPNMTIPSSGSVYSCNEANSEGWDEPFKQYLRTIKKGQGRTQQPYALRYVGSMVGDIHRTLLYGGLFAYPADSDRHPRGHLPLLYKSAPMALILQNAGGKSIDGRGNNLLDLQPEYLHQKSPCFMGSPGDVEELASYLT